MKRYHYTEEDFATKEAAQASLMRLLAPLKEFYSESGARLEIGVTSAHYENDTVPMEAFARPALGAGAFLDGRRIRQRFRKNLCKRSYSRRQSGASGILAYLPGF